MSTKSNFYPDWEKKSPPPNSYRSVFKWGDLAKFKHPNKRLYNFLKQELELTDDDFAEKQRMGMETARCENPSVLSSEHIEALRRIVGETNLATDDYSRVKYSNGKTAEEALNLREQIAGKTADIVVHPGNAAEVQKITAYCHREKIPLYVYGGGSSVNMGFKAVKGGVVLAMNTYMNRVLELNELNQTITVEAGMMGPDYEKALNNAPNILKASRSYTGGHFPQSFEYSSVGGWAVTFGSGQQSSYYGDVCDLVVSQEYVTPRGTFKTLDYPGTATGPKVNDIMLGSEGCFGVLTSVTMKIFRHMPENRQRFAFIFPDWESTVNASREIIQGEFGSPSMFRISDPGETNAALKLYGIEGTPLEKFISLRGYKPLKRCLCIGQADGERSFAKLVKKNARRICKRHGAMYITGLPVKQWERGRFSDPYMREDLNDFGIVIDTLESGVTWDNLHNLHKGVRNFIKERPRTICLTHASHFYPQGTNLYFIFIGKIPEREEYKKFQDGIIETIHNCGGSLSHHHGAGKMMSPWMERHLGKEQMDVLRALKNHFDPHNVMNPGGTLGLDGQDRKY